MKRSRRHHLRQRVAEVIDAVARQRRNHEGPRKIQAVVGGLGERQQLFALNQIDLVQHQDFLVLDARQFGEDRVGFFVDAFARIEQHANQVGVMRPAPGGGHHGAIEPPLR